MAADWRERYLKLADEAEAQQQAEKELTRLLTRVCVAVSGLDPLLDPHLKQLREAAKGGQTARLLQRAEPIASALANAADERSQPTVLPRLLERGPLKRRQINDVQRLWAEVAAAPADATDVQLDKLGELLRQGLVSDQDSGASNPGLLARFIGRPSDAVRSGSNRQLLDVLKAIDWPTSLRRDVEGFEQELVADERDEVWIAVVRQIGELAVQALAEAQDNARSAEQFLTELNRHLEDLDQHMLSEGERREQSRESAERLGQRMSGEVDRLSDDVRTSVDLSQLQTNVLGSIERMRTHVEDHLRDESERREAAEAESQALRAQMRELEEDTFDLRRKVAQTHEQALRDPLTGLPNRRAYDERLTQEYARWKRFGEPLALLVWDVDDFKVINDSFGHKSGDKALIMIGKILRARLRETDFIARYGGEELVVLFTGAKAPDVLRLAEDMRRAVEEGGLHAHGRPVRVTVSGGVAMFAAGDSPVSVFERADAAMYKAKQQGKNQVVSSVESG